MDKNNISFLKRKLKVKNIY